MCSSQEKHYKTLFLYLCAYPQLTPSSTLSVLILHPQKLHKLCVHKTTAHNAIQRMEERTMPVCGACRCIYLYYSNLHLVLFLFAGTSTYVPTWGSVCPTSDCRSTPCFPCTVIGVMPWHEKFPFLIGFRNDVIIIQCCHI